MSEKVALITGATGGLGQALANVLIDDGYQLILTSRNATRLSTVYGNKHLQIQADCATVEGAKHIFYEINAHKVIPTVFAHCVGNIKLGALHRITEADFNECMQANLFSAFHTLAAFISHLKTAKLAGSAVLVSSAAAQIGTPNHEAISAAKGGLEALVRGAAATYASNSIRVNAVAPGLLDTPAAASLVASDASRGMAARQYPIVGIGNAPDVARLMVWLLSDHAARVTGQIWSIDGGFSSIRPIVK
ncbi:MAG: NAD(P)-dependent dehydrogenase (short-subunit alcohol dehydrogenase family) [Methylophilaceae bacterium]|jgi:NAD(P)-dependent dehydrogenase (short-subunit alcohol dehydrogenase family)